LIPAISAMYATSCDVLLKLSYLNGFPLANRHSRSSCSHHQTARIRPRQSTRKTFLIEQHNPLSVYFRTISAAAESRASHEWLLMLGRQCVG
jgi:hypothetical protein